MYAKRALDLFFFRMQRDFAMEKTPHFSLDGNETMVP